MMIVLPLKTESQLMKAMKAMILDLSSEQLYEDIINRAKHMGGDEHPSGFTGLLESTAALEQALAVLTKCHAVQTTTCLMMMKNQKSSFSPQLLGSWLEASNRSLETMIMYQWVTLTRKKEIFQYWLVSLESKKNESIPPTILEAARQTNAAVHDLVEAKIQLVSQLTSKLQQASSLGTSEEVVEKEALLALHCVEELLRILARKQSLLTTLGRDQGVALDTWLKEMRPAMFTSVKKLEGQITKTPLFSKDLISKLREALNRLIECYSAPPIPHTPSRLFFEAEPPLPEPWLNEKVFGRRKKGR
ncbi:hypothetical protein [Brevibacillus sp. NRS-1366]|uniref:hypothetical protein n=1 Tax=Brevibacillus sp. NRS-1366 TaxID=3233899 RepID=UPI003D217F2B